MLQRVMYASKQIIVISCVAAMIGCNSGHDDNTTSGSPAPTTNQAPSEPSGSQTGDGQTNGSNTDQQRGNVAGTQNHTNETQTPAAPPPQAVNPTPNNDGGGKSSPTPPPTADNAPTLGEIESALPPVSPYDTYGGQLLVGYLGQQIPDVQVVNAVFAQDEYVLSNLAEMSLAIHQMQDDGKYTAQDSQQVQILEGALTDFMNARAESDRNLATAVQYGSAVVLGVIGGYNADRIVNGVRTVSGPLLGTPIRRVWNATTNLGRKVGNGVLRAGDWVESQGAKVAESTPVATVREKSRSLFTRAMAWNAARGGNLSTQDQVVANIARALNSPTLAKGYRVVAVPADELEAAERLVFYKTGVPGFRINQREGDNFLTARIVNSEGGFDYFHVRGNAIDTMTEKGETMVLPTQTALDLLTSRLKNFGQSTADAVENTATKAKEGITNSNAYKYVTTDPVFGERLKRTAVGGTIGVMTLLALRSVDPEDLTLNGYVHDLQAQGIHLEDFINGEQAYTQSAMTPDAALAQ